MDDDFWARECTDFSSFVGEELGEVGSPLALVGGDHRVDVPVLVRRSASLEIRIHPEDCRPGVSTKMKKRDSRKSRQKWEGSPLAEAEVTHPFGE